MTEHGLQTGMMLLVSMLLFAGTIPLVAQTNVSFQYFYDDLGQLTKVVDSTGTIIEYVYDPVGNILQIKRSGVAPGTLAIFSFTPQRGGIGEAVTIQGQGFSNASAGNVVQFDGTPASVISASPTTVVAQVPNGATTGPITVSVGAQRAISSTNFTVLQIPAIISLSRKSALFNTAVLPFTITGINLTNATFDFSPVGGIAVTLLSIDPSGTSATMSLKTSNRAGIFALVGTNNFGSSSPIPVKANRFTVVDPLSKADTDGDGIPDVLEAEFGSDPLDPTSIPFIPKPPGEAESLSFSVVNGFPPLPPNTKTGESESVSFSVLNGFTVGNVNINTGEAESLSFSVANGFVVPTPNPSTAEAESLTFSVVNGTTPPAINPPTGEAESLTFSVSNSAPIAEITPRNSNRSKSSALNQSPGSKFENVNRNQEKDKDLAEDEPSAGSTRSPNKSKSSQVKGRSMRD